MIFNRSSVMLLMAGAALVAICHAASGYHDDDQQKEVAHFEIGDAKVDVELLYSLTDKPMSPNGMDKLNNCYESVVAAMDKFLTTVTSPEFSGTLTNWQAAVQQYVESMTNQARLLVDSREFVDNEDKYWQLSAIRHLVTEARRSWPWEEEKLAAVEGKTANEIVPLIGTVKEALTKGESNWTFDIPSIKIDGVPLQELLEQQMTLLTKMGLLRAVDGLASGVIAFWKEVYESHSAAQRPSALSG